MPAAEPPRISALFGHVAEGAYGTGGGTTPGVILAEKRCAALAQINGAGEPAGVAALRQTLALATSPAPRRASTGNGVTLMWIGPGMWLAEASRHEPRALRSLLRDALAGTAATVTDLSHGRTCIGMTGPGIRQLLAKGCPIDADALKAGDCVVTRIAQFGVVIHLCADDAMDVFVARSFGLAFWQWLGDAAADLGYQVRAIVAR